MPSFRAQRNEPWPTIFHEDFPTAGAARGVLVARRRLHRPEWDCHFLGRRQADGLAAAIVQLRLRTICNSDQVSGKARICDSSAPERPSVQGLRA